MVVLGDVQSVELDCGQQNIFSVFPPLSNSFI